MKTLLHVGCGSSAIKDLPNHFQDGSWQEIRYDIDSSVAPDIVGSLQDMSLIEDTSIDAIFSSHNIEHVSSFEIPGVLSEFFRVLKPEGFAIILCPDILSVAEAITHGALTEPLYISAAGPINAIDIIYGYQSALQKGDVFMAHKMAFTDRTLAEALLAAGFLGSVVARDKIFGLHSISTKTAWPTTQMESFINGILPKPEFFIGLKTFGCYEQILTSQSRFTP